MKFLFVLGRNPELSTAELKSVFPNLEYKQKENAILTNLENIHENLINRLGGTIAIGKVLCEVKELDKIDLHKDKSNKFNYTLWNFSENHQKVSEYLKKRFKEEKLKATEKPLQKMQTQDREILQSPASSKNIQKQFFVFEEYFGEMQQLTDYEQIEKRDMKKPVRRESLAISPKLAKIMINISQAKSSETLVDPFCGVGVILQEALLQKIKIIGIDKDREAIDDTKKNLEWFRFKKEDYKLIRTDSSKAEIKKADVLVTEPDFGKIRKRSPTTKEAKSALQEYENLMVKVLNNLKQKVKGRFVFTSPLIKLHTKKRLGCNIQNILDKTGLKLVAKPLPEFRENQIIGREIVVMRK